MQVALRCAVLCGAVSRVLLSSGTIALCCVVFSLRALAGIQPSYCRCRPARPSSICSGDGEHTHTHNSMVTETQTYEDTDLWGHGLMGTRTNGDRD